jgi:hypothetical protein
LKTTESKDKMKKDSEVKKKELVEKKMKDLE